MSAPTIIEINDVSKSFVLHRQKSLKDRLLNARSESKHREEFWALRDIDLTIDAGSTVGLVGHNGSGKSTLLKVLGGIIEPSSGTVRRRGRMAALLELGAGFHPDLSGRENVYLNAAILGLTEKEIDRVFDAIVEFSGIEAFIDTQVKFYSSGMYVRLAFAVAVHVDPDLLLVDEVLAVGDEMFQRKCIDKIAEFQREGRTIILVSHSAAQVEALADRVVVLDHGRMTFDGQPDEGLRVLRFGYEQQLSQLAHDHGSTPAPAHIPVASRIESVVLVPADGAAPRSTEPRINSGDSARLSMTYSLAEPQDRLIAEVVIDSINGEPIYGVSSQALGVEIPGTPGRHVVEFTLGQLPLGQGRYLLRGHLQTTEGVTIDRVNPASDFVVDSVLPGGGFLRVPVTAVVR
ncbi:ABC transporter ATP-binding protein [Agromyces bauzanensis]